MTPPNPTSGTGIEQRFLNRFEELSRVSSEASRFLEAAAIEGQPAYVANLTIEELGTNILKYGYDDTAVHEILLQVDLEPGTLRIVFEDDGHPFNPLDVPEPDLDLPVEERALGGLGIHLVRQLAHHFSYERCNGRNRVTVEVKL